MARGDYVVFFDAGASLTPGALAALVESHDRGCGIVSGNVANRTESAVGWASYFADPAHCSFAREPLMRIGGFDEHLTDGLEALARDRLLEQGQRAAHTPLVTFGHRTDLRASGDYLGQRFALGRAAAHDARGPLSTLIRRDARRLAGTWRARPADRAESSDRVWALVVGGALATWAGAVYERLAPRRSRPG